MRLRQRLIGLLALLVLLGVLIGLPAVLIALGGNPLPSSVPTPDQVRDALLAPDDGTLVLAAAQILGWVVWALLVAALLVELACQVRGIKAPTMPGLRVPQAAMRPLVSAVLALFISAPTTALIPTTASATPQHSTSAPVATATAPTAPAPAPDTDDQVEATEPPPAEEHQVHEVRPGDTLWSIAERHLGSGRLFGRIVEANPDVLTHGADWITPGMRLRIPQAPPAPTGTVTVVAGDTLSGLAAQHLHDPGRWPELFDATTGITQPDGQQLTDPDLIHPGWLIHLPSDQARADDPGPAPDQAPPVDATESGTTPHPPAAPRAPATRDRPVPDQTPHRAAEPAGPVLTGGAIAAQAGARVGSTTTAGSRPATTDTDRPPVLQAAGDTLQAPGWVLPGLTASGALLAAGLLLALTARRRAASRHRRPGRTLPTPAPALIPVEKTIQSYGAAAAPSLEHLDEVLRRLGGSCYRTGAPVPPLTAVQLAADTLVLHLADPATLDSPWEGSQDQLSWRIPGNAPLDDLGPLDPDGPAPYPLLVTIGTAQDGTTWLLNLEDHQVHLTGDPLYLHDLARHLAAQVAVNPWAAGVHLACVGIAHEVVAMNPARLRTAGPDAVEEVLAGAVDLTTRLDPAIDAPTARMRRDGDELWPAQLLLLHASHTDQPATSHLSQHLRHHPGRTSTALGVCPMNGVSGVHLRGSPRPACGRRR